MVNWGELSPEINEIYYLIFVISAARCLLSDKKYLALLSRHTSQSQGFSQLIPFGVRSITYNRKLMGNKGHKKGKDIF